MDVPRQVIGIVVPLPTVMPEEGGGRRDRSIPSEDDMWAVAPVSRTQGGRPLEGHLVQGGNEAGLIPAAMLLRGWRRGVGELGGGERRVRLG